MNESQFCVQCPDRDQQFLNLGILQNSWQELKKSDSRALPQIYLLKKLREEDCWGICICHKPAGASHVQSGLGTNDIGAPVSGTQGEIWGSVVSRWMLKSAYIWLLALSFAYCYRLLKFLSLSTFSYLKWVSYQYHKMPKPSVSCGMVESEKQLSFSMGTSHGMQTQE